MTRVTLAGFVHLITTGCASRDRAIAGRWIGWEQGRDRYTEAFDQSLALDSSLASLAAPSSRRGGPKPSGARWEAGGTSFVVEFAQDGGFRDPGGAVTGSGLYAESRDTARVSGSSASFAVSFAWTADSLVWVAPDSSRRIVLVRAGS